MSDFMRITGLASGLDVDTLVKQLMRVESMKLDKVKQDRQIIQWKQELYRDLIGSMNTFKSTYFDVLKSDTYMLSERNYSSFNVKTSDNAGFTATAFAGAVAGDYKVTVSQLAERARIEGTSPINVEQALNDFAFSARISDGTVIGEADNRTISIAVGTSTYSIALDKNDYSMSYLVTSINSKLSEQDALGKVKAQLSDDGQYIRFAAIKTLDDSNKTLTIKVDGGADQTITLDKGDYTYDNLADLINIRLKDAGLDGKLQASMSDAGNGISFSLPEGVTSTVTVNGFAAGSTDANGIYSTTLGVTNPNATLNNELKYDRKIYEGVNDTLTFKINGVQYDLDLGDTADGYGKPGEAGAFTNEDIRKDLVYKLHNAIAANAELSSKMDVRLSMDGTRMQLVSKTNETVTVGGNSLKTLGFTGSFDVNQSVSDKMSNLFAGLSYDSTGVVPASSGIVDFVVNNGTESVRFRYDFTRDTDDTTQDPPVVGAKIRP
jgi:flagellar hook-associated protein 2